MAQYVYRTTGDFHRFVQYVDDAILSGSATASLEESYNSSDNTFAMRAYERYSYFGSNRVSLTVSIVSHGTYIELIAMATGGSQAVFFKVNTWGESSFLQNLINSLEAYTPS